MGVAITYSIGIIIPWFGKLPSTYLPWKKSVLKNDSIDWFLFTGGSIDFLVSFTNIKKTKKQNSL